MAAGSGGAPNKKHGPYGGLFAPELVQYRAAGQRLVLTDLADVVDLEGRAMCRACDEVLDVEELEGGLCEQCSIPVWTSRARPVLHVPCRDRRARRPVRRVPDAARARRDGVALRPAVGALNAPAVIGGGTSLAGRRMETLRTQMAPGASDEEIEFFAEVCNELDLSPWAGQIVLIGRWSREARRRVFKHQVTNDGRLALAHRTGQLVGIEGPLWSGPRVDGDLHWLDVWDDDGAPPYVARCLVHRAGWIAPANGTAKWSEFAQRNKDGELEVMWSRMPSHMLGKVALSMALRRAFPETIAADVISGFDPDEVELADAQAEQVVIGSADEHRAPYGDPVDPLPASEPDDAGSALPVAPSGSVSVGHAKKAVVAACGGDLDAAQTAWNHWFGTDHVSTVAAVALDELLDQLEQGA